MMQTQHEVALDGEKFDEPLLRKAQTAVDGGGKT